MNSSFSCYWLFAFPLLGISSLWFLLTAARWAVAKNQTKPDWPSNSAHLYVLAWTSGPGTIARSESVKRDMGGWHTGLHKPSLCLEGDPRPHITHVPGEGDWGSSPFALFCLLWLKILFATAYNKVNMLVIYNPLLAALSPESRAASPAQGWGLFASWNVRLFSPHPTPITQILSPSLWGSSLPLAEDWGSLPSCESPLPWGAR